MPITPSTRLYQCLRCYRQVMVCQSCDHGQRYCARGCRQQARQASCKRAQIKYQTSHKGRISNAQRQRRFRQRQEKTKIVTHQTSLSIPVNDLLIDEKPIVNKSVIKKPKTQDHNVCHFCGCLCGPLFRVSFLKKRTTYPYRSKTAIGETFNGP